MIPALQIQVESCKFETSQSYRARPSLTATKLSEISELQFLRYIPAPGAHTTPLLTVQLLQTAVFNCLK